MSGDLSVTIRAATADDASAIDDLLRSLGWFEQLNSRPSEVTAERIRGQIAALARSANTLLVAEATGGEVAGYVFVHWLPNLLFGGEGYVSELFLRAEYRGRGIGAALLDEAKQEGRARGCLRLTLFNRKQRESYQRGFYPKHGWVERDDTALFMYPLDDDSRA